MRLPWKVSFELSMLSIKFIIAFYQMCFCLLSNVYLFANKSLRF